MNYENSIIPGFTNKAHKETEKQIKNLKDRRDSIAEAIKSNKKYYDEKEAPLGKKGEAYETMLKQMIMYDEISAQIKDLENSLSSGSFPIDPGYNNEHYIGSERGYSLGDINGRDYIGYKLDRLPLDQYDFTYIASKYIEGIIPEVSFTDLLIMLKTKEDDSIMFDSDIVFGPGLKDDDKANVEKAIAHAHDIGMINAENEKAFQVLREAKDPITISHDEVHVAVNRYICAKGKLKTVIIVNGDGFAKLDDVDSNGYPLVKRVGDKFFYRDKYEIQEVDNKILPNTDNNKSPIIVGDLSIVKFFIMRDDALEKDDFLEYKVHDRRLKREIIALTTTSDRAYIHGVLS